MLIERTNKEIIIRLPSFVDYLPYKEATSKSKAKQSDIDALSKEVKKGWWAENRSRIVR